MAYSAAARAMRRCLHPCRDGSTCRCWAVWGDPLRRCSAHGGRHPEPAFGRDGDPSDGRTRPIHCRCVAYAWPHRPGGGLCRWPDPPVYRRTTPAGTHAAYRVRPPRVVFRLGWRGESQPGVWLRT